MNNKNSMTEYFTSQLFSLVLKFLFFYVLLEFNIKALLTIENTKSCLHKWSG